MEEGRDRGKKGKVIEKKEDKRDERKESGEYQLKRVRVGQATGFIV